MCRYNPREGTFLPNIVAHQKIEPFKDFAMNAAFNVNTFIFLAL